MILMTIILFIIGFLDFGRSKSGVVWAQASLMDIWTFIYQMTVGPVSEFSESFIPHFIRIGELYS